LILFAALYGIRLAEGQRMGNKNHLYLLLVITGIAVTIFSLWGMVALNSPAPVHTSSAVASEETRDSENSARATIRDASLRPTTTHSDPQP
jgi:hypothetical protein